MQLNLKLEQPQPTKNAWAFAIDRQRVGIRSRRASLASASRDLNRYVITACSKEAKQLGVRVGMRLPQAKNRLPGLKILVCN